MDIRKEAEKLALKFLERVIAQAYAEGATSQAIDHYLSQVMVPPISDPEVWRARVEAKKVAPLLGDIEMRNLGGRDTFRSMFGLAAAATLVQPTHKPDYPFTESGDAEFFANKYADYLRYDHRRGRWLFIDPETGIWVPDPIEHVTVLALTAIRKRQAKALKSEGHPKERQEAITWTVKGESKSRLMNTLAIAASLPPIADEGDAWDLDPMLLGCSNGVVDLRTGVLRKAAPEEKISQQVRTAYDPNAQCPLWEQSVAGIFAGPDAEESTRVVAFFQRALGYSITGDCREECCFFTWGEGSNGKGLTMNTVGWLMSTYYDDMPMSTLEKSVRSGGIPNDVAKLVGKRFITCSEVNEFTLNESRLKALTGRDPMTARFLREEFFTFIPVGKIWIASNNKPRIVGQDEGIWRRIHLIPFTNTFEGPNKRKELKDELREELPGILTWLVKGTMSWLSEGLNPPETVKVATLQYRQESDILTPFIEGYLQDAETAKTQAQALWTLYQQYCQDRHIEEHMRLSNKAFFKAARRRWKTTEERNVLFVWGVGPRSNRSDEPPPTSTPF